MAENRSRPTQPNLPKTKGFMNITVVHNSYYAPSGEETVVNGLLDLLATHGHETSLFTRSSAEISKMVLGKVRAFFSGVYSFRMQYAFRRFLHETRPDVVHVHNVFPFISPSILAECRRAKVPTVMSVHNYRLVCPNGLHLPKSDPRPCEKCCGGHEYWCVLKNCEGNLLKSLGYALRNYVARKAQLFRANVSVYGCLTEYQKRRLVAAGFPEERMAIIPNMVSPMSRSSQAGTGDYVGFVGRVSPEKGIDVFVAAARRCPDIPFKVAGKHGGGPCVRREPPANCLFLGEIASEGMTDFYAASRLIVVPSLWYEAFGLSAAEAQAHGKAVICSRMGALPEIVEDKVTGLLTEAGNADKLAEKIRYLWERPDLCERMGLAGQAKVVDEYSLEKYYERTMAMYEKALRLGQPGPAGRTRRAS